MPPCAALAHVNVSVLYQFVDTAKPPWPTSVAPRRGLSRSGSAWPGRSQKDGLPSCRGRVCIQRFKAIDSREEGQPGCCPFHREREWTPRRATLLCSPPFRSSAQASPGEFKVASGEMSESEFTAFLEGFIRLAVQHSQDGSIHFVFLDWRHLPELLSAAWPIYEKPRHRTRDAWPAVGFALVLARGISICGTSARARLGLTFPRRA